MKLVINIPDYDYEYIMNGCIVPIKFDNHIYEAIRNGTPLPKGHGRLIYAKDVGEYLTLADVPTIIEAEEDREDEVSN